MKFSYRPHQQLHKTVFSRFKFDEIRCLGVNDDSSKFELGYVGQTKKQLHKWFTQHKLCLKKTADGQSALVTHSEDYGHCPGFENAKVIDNESYLSRRLTLECLHILTRAVIA